MYKYHIYKGSLFCRVVDLGPRRCRTSAWLATLIDMFIYRYPLVCISEIMKYRIVHKTRGILLDGIAEWDIDYEWMTLFMTQECASEMQHCTIEVDTN